MQAVVVADLAGAVNPIVVMPGLMYAMIVARFRVGAATSGVRGGIAGVSRSMVAAAMTAAGAIAAVTTAIATAAATTASAVATTITAATATAATVTAATVATATTATTAPTTSAFFRLGTRYPGQAVRNQDGRRR